MVEIGERGVPRRGTRPGMAPGARGRTTSHHRAPNMVVETRARGRGADSAPRRGMSAAPPCQSGSGRLARPGGRKQVLGRLIIYIPVERASQIRQLLSSASSASRTRAAIGSEFWCHLLIQCAERGKWTPLCDGYVTNPLVSGRTENANDAVWHSAGHYFSRAKQGLSAVLCHEPLVLPVFLQEAVDVLLSLAVEYPPSQWVPPTRPMQQETQIRQAPVDGEKGRRQRFALGIRDCPVGI